MAILPPTGTENQLELHQDPQEGEFNVDPGFEASKIPPLGEYFSRTSKWLGFEGVGV